MHLKVVGDQIIQVCKTKILLFIVFFYFLFPQKNIFLKSYENQLLSNTESGNYLSWLQAERNSDLNASSFFLSKFSGDLSDKEIILKALMSALMINDWESSINLSKKVIVFDQANFFANLILSVDSFKNKEIFKSKKFLNNINHSDIDKSFIDVIRAWILVEEKKVDSALNSLKNNGKGDSEECLPIICLHEGLINNLYKSKKVAEKKFDKLLFSDAYSLRLSEILLNFFADIKHKKNAGIVINKIKNNHNIKNIDYYNLEENLKKVKNPSDGLAESFYNISTWFFERKLYKFSIYFSNIALNLRDDLPALRLLLANNYNKVGIYDKSLMHLKSINNNSPYSHNSIFLKFNLLNNLGKKDELINSLKFEDSVNENNKIKILLADVHRGQGLYEKALEYYNSVIDEIDKPRNKDWNIFYSRGITNERLKNWDNADKDFLMSLKLNPNEPYVLNYLGYSWLERKININKALEILSLAANLEPNDAYIIDSLGWAHFLSGNFAKSIDFLELAVTMSPNDSTLNDHLGDAYWKMGRYREAVSQWKRILVFDPNFERKNEIKTKILSGL